MKVIVGTRDAVNGESVWLYTDAGVLLATYDTGGSTVQCVQDISGNIYVVGAAADNSDGNGTRNLWKLSANGVYINGYYVASAGSAYCVALDNSKNMYVGIGNAAYKISSDFSSQTTITSSGGYSILVDTDRDSDIYSGSQNGLIYKHNSSLVLQWTENSAHNYNVYGLGLLSGGDIIAGIGGYLHRYKSDGTSGTEGEWNVLIFSPSNQIRLAIDSNDAIYCVQFNSTEGTRVWITKRSAVDGSSTWDYSHLGKDLEGIIIDADDNILVCGDRYDRGAGNATTWVVAETPSLTAWIDSGDNAKGCAGIGEVGTPTIVDKTYTKQLVVVGNDQLWYESSAGTMSVLSSAVVDISKPLIIFEAFQKVFVVNESTIKVADFGNVKITTANVASHPPDKGNILTGGSSTAQMVVDYATALTSACTIYGQRITTATFTSGETVTGTDDDGNTISFVTSAAEVAGPHWYDWTVYGNSSTFGAMPAKATLGCLYRGRGVLSGNSQYPNQWYMSRVGNLWDFNYDSLDALSAVAGNNADAGEIGDIVNALIPYKDDFLIFGCANTMWVLVGDPASGGSIDELDLTVGIFGSKSWCFDSKGDFYFWGTAGIYVCPYGGGRPSRPQLLTGLSLPKLIKDEVVDVETHRIVLTYDPYREGILIFITDLSDGSNSNYWYDLKTQGFFPESYPDACGVMAAYYYTATANAYTDLIVGGYDGYLRKYLDSAKDDDAGASNTAIGSYLTVVQSLGDGEDIKGKLTSLTITTAGGASGSTFGNTDKVSYEYHTGDDAETVLENIIDAATARESGTIDNTAATGVAPGRQSRIRKRIRGHYFGLKLYNSTESETFAVEKITGEIKPAGKN